MIRFKRYTKLGGFLAVIFAYKCYIGTDEKKSSQKNLKAYPPLP